MNGRQPEIIGVISGKGGTGKTGVCIAIGQLLSYVGKRVLLIDLDTATLGMTHYFAPRLKPNEVGLLEPKGHPIRLTTRSESSDANIFYFLPLTTDLEAPDISDTEPVVDERVTSFIRREAGNFDAIVIDFQAGFSGPLHAVAPLLTSAVIVTEADPVSVGAVSRLRRSLGRALRAPTFGLINKIMPDENAYYEAMADLIPDIAFLSALPFDSGLRKEFFRRGDPVDPKQLGPYGSALLQGLRRLTPEFSDSLDSISIAPSRRSAEQLHELRDDIEARLVELLTRERRRRVLAAATVMVTVSAAAFSIPLLISAKSSVLIVAVIAAVSTVIAATIVGLTISRPTTRFEIDRQRELLRQVEQRSVEFDLANISQELPLKSSYPRS